MIEQVLMKTTLKAGDKIWVEGALIDAPIPEVLLEEIHLGTGTVEVIKKVGSHSPTDKLIFVAEKVKEKAGPNITTMTSMSAPDESLIKEPRQSAKTVKAKPLLKRRKK